MGDQRKHVGSVLFFYHVGPEGGTQIITKLGDKCVFPTELSHWSPHSNFDVQLLLCAHYFHAIVKQTNKQTKKVKLSHGQSGTVCPQNK